MTRRRVAAAVVVVAVVAGIGIHLAAPPTRTGDIAADALYVVVVYGALVVLAPQWRPAGVGAATMLWCVAVELFQLTGLPEQWGRAAWPVMLVFGTVFDPRDFVVYGVGAIVCAVMDAMLPRRRRTRPGSHG